MVGEINPDLILYGLPKELKPEQEILIDGFRLTLGSSSAIFAHNLSALGTRVGIISKIGGDPLGKMALDWLAIGGVDVSRVLRANRTATGLTVILSHPGERFILTYPGTMFELSYADLEFDYIFPRGTCIFRHSFCTARCGRNRRDVSTGEVQRTHHFARHQ